MKLKLTLATILTTLAFSIIAGTNTLTLTWLQPPGYQSTLYSSTNLGGGWSSLGTANPPYSTEETNKVSFFYVSVAPTNYPNSDVIYTNDPNVEGLKPASTNKPSIAYKDDGSGAIYGWSITSQMWK